MNFLWGKFDSDFWTHFYGLIGVLALVIQIWPVISPRFLRFSFGSSERKKTRLLEEIEVIQLHAKNDVYVQRFFRAMIANCLSWAIPGLFFAFSALKYKDGLELWGFEIGFTLFALCTGNAVGIAMSLRIRMNQYLHPEDEIQKLKARLQKL